MKTAFLYKHPDKGFKAIKFGFSWPAFFFMLFWAFVKRLYGFGLLMFFIWLAIVAVYMMAVFQSMDYPDIIYTLLLLCYAFVMGFLGNRYLSKDLLKKGYKHVKTVETDSLKAALEIVSEKSTIN